MERQRIRASVLAAKRGEFDSVSAVEFKRATLEWKRGENPEDFGSATLTQYTLKELTAVDEIYTPQEGKGWRAGSFTSGSVKKKVPKGEADEFSGVVAAKDRPSSGKTQSKFRMFRIPGTEVYYAAKRITADKEFKVFTGRTKAELESGKHFKTVTRRVHLGWDIVGLINNDKEFQQKVGALTPIMLHAFRHLDGELTLDCFDVEGFLPDMYALWGFEPGTYNEEAGEFVWDSEGYDFDYQYFPDTNETKEKAAERFDRVQQYWRATGWVPEYNDKGEITNFPQVRTFRSELTDEKARRRAAEDYLEIWAAYPGRDSIARPSGARDVREVPDGAPADVQAGRREEDGQGRDRVPVEPSEEQRTLPTAIGERVRKRKDKFARALDEYSSDPEEAGRLADRAHMASVYSLLPPDEETKIKAELDSGKKMSEKREAKLKRRYARLRAVRLRELQLSPEKNSVGDIAMALADHVQREVGFRGKPGEYSEEDIQYAAKAIAYDLLYVLEQEATNIGVGWYDRAMKEMWGNIKVFRPEIVKKRADERIAYTLALAILSQGHDIQANLAKADIVYENYVSTGVLRRPSYLGGGKAVNAIDNNFRLVGELLSTKEINGSWQKLDKMFRDPGKVSEISRRYSEIMPLKDGKKQSLGSDELAEEQLNNAIMMGPKIGSFYLNLSGRFDTLTADLWFSRTFNRYFGTTSGRNWSAQNSSVRKIMGMLDDGEIKNFEGQERGDGTRPVYTENDLRADPDALMDWAENKFVTWQRLSSSSGKTQKERDAASAAASAYLDIQENKTGKRLAESEAGSQDAPRTGAERRAMRQSMQRAIKIVERAIGREIEMADAQAMLWILEKELHISLGGAAGSGSPDDFARASRRHVVLRGYAEPKPKDFDDPQWVVGLSKTLTSRFKELHKKAKRGDKPAMVEMLELLRKEYRKSATYDSEVEAGTSRFQIKRTPENRDEAIALRRAYQVRPKIPNMAVRWREGKVKQARTFLADEYYLLQKATEDLRKKYGFVPESIDALNLLRRLPGLSGHYENELEAKVMKPLVKEIKKAGETVETIGEIAFAYHAEERNQTLLQKHGEGKRDSGMTDIEARRIKDKWKAKSNWPQVKRILVKVHRIGRESLETMRVSGTITEEDYERIRGRYRYFVPLVHLAGEDAEELDQNTSPSNISIIGKGTRGARGRTVTGENRAERQKDISSAIVGNIMAQRLTVTRRAFKNAVANRILKTAMHFEEPDLWEVVSSLPLDIQTVDGKPQPAFVRKEGEEVPVRKSPKEFAEDPQNMGVRLQEDTVIGGRIHRRGELVFVRIKDKLIAEILTKGQKGTPGEEWSWFGRVMHGASVPFRYATTLARITSVNLYNPDFTITNPIRDIQMAMSTQATDHGQYKKTIRGMVRNLPQAINSVAHAEFRRLFGLEKPKQTRMQKYWQEMQEFGGRQILYDIQDEEQVQKRIRRLASDSKLGKTARMSKRVFVDAWDILNTAFDNGVRLSAYTSLREAGMSPEKAAAAARDMTVDFSKKGTGGKTINQYYVFANATIQGNVKVARLAKSRRGMQILGGVVAFGYINNLMGRMLMGDDEDDDGLPDWENIPEHVKRNNIVIPVPGHRDADGKRLLIKIPIPYGFNAFFNMGRQIDRVTTGAASPGEGVHSVGLSFITAFNPIGAENPFADGGLWQLMAPTLLDPMAQHLSNADWKGDPIYQEPWPGDENIALRSQMGRDSTGDVWHQTAEAINQVSGGSSTEPGMMDIQPEIYRHYLFAFVNATGKNFERIGNMGSTMARGELPDLRGIPIARRLAEIAPTDYAVNDDYFSLREKILYAKKVIKRSQDISDDENATPLQKERADSQYFDDWNKHKMELGFSDALKETEEARTFTRESLRKLNLLAELRMEQGNPMTADEVEKAEEKLWEVLRESQRSLLKRYRAAGGHIPKE